MEYLISFLIGLGSTIIFSLISIILNKIYFQKKEWEQIINNWFEDFVYNTNNLINEKEHYEPPDYLIKIIFGGKTKAEIKKLFNNGGKEDWLKYHYLIEIDNKEHQYFVELCNAYKIIDRKGFREYIKNKNDKNHKNNEIYMKYKNAIEKSQEINWESWKL